MKRKHLLTAIALPALLAACTQDALLDDAAQKTDFSNIPTVDVDFTVATGAETRLATQWGWEVGDKVGMAWLGDGTTIKGNAEKAYQNIPLYCQTVGTSSATFKAETLLYVGDYFAYIPYDENLVTVSPVVFTTEGQELATTTAGYAKNAYYVSPKVTLENKEDATYKPGLGKNLPLELEQVSNAVTVNLTFDTETMPADLKVMGISISAQDDQSSEVLPVSFEYKADGNATPTASSDYDTYAETVKKGAVTVSSTEGIAVPTTGKLTVYALIFPANGTVEAVAVNVITNYGVVIVESNAEGSPIAVKNGKTTATTVAAADIFTKFGKSGTLEVAVDMNETSFDEQTVSTQAELTSLLNAAASVAYESPIEITINPATANDDNNFVLTDFTLPATLKAAVTLKTGDNATNGLVFGGSTVINKSLTLGSPATVAGTVTVNKKIELTVNNNLKVSNDATLTNNGTITVANESSLTTVAAVTGKVAKAAGLYVSGGTFSGTFNNNGAIKWTAGTLPTLTGEQSGVVYAEVTNIATMVAADKAKVPTLRFVTTCEFTSTTSPKFENVKKIECYKPVTINLNKSTELDAASTIEFSGLTDIEVLNGGGALSIISDNAKNELIFSADEVKVAVGNEDADKNDATLAMSNLILNATMTIDNWGETTITNVTMQSGKTMPEHTGDGTWIVTNKNN